nr:uncharacterized protein PEAK3 [Vicugna pacos]
MSSLEPPTETPGPNAPTWQTQPTYGNLGEVRAHLLPSKACRPRTFEALSTDPQPLPPPLPKKTLTRAQSLPTHKAPRPSPTQAGETQKPLLGSHSVDKSQAGDDRVGPACPPEELPFCSLDPELGLSFHDLHRPEAVHAALEARQLESLRGMHVRLQARLLGGRPGPCRPGHGFRLLDLSPCLESGDALYYRLVRVDEEAWHLLAAKVPRPGAEEPHPWGLELQASLAPHFNLQGLCGLVPRGALPEMPWDQPVVLAAEVPELTVAQWLEGAGAQPPAKFTRAVALLLLQLSAALAHLEARGAALVELRPENMLLVVPRGCTATGPPRLLLADFGRVRPRSPGPLGAHAQQLGHLLRERRQQRERRPKPSPKMQVPPPQGWTDGQCCPRLSDATAACPFQVWNPRQLMSFCVWNCLHAFQQEPGCPSDISRGSLVPPESSGAPLQALHTLWPATPATLPILRCSQQAALQPCGSPTFTPPHLSAPSAETSVPHLWSSPDTC